MIREEKSQGEKVLQGFLKSLAIGYTIGKYFFLFLSGQVDFNVLNTSC